MRHIALCLSLSICAFVPATAQVMSGKFNGHPRHPPQMSSNAFSLTNGLDRQRQFLVLASAGATSGSSVTIDPGKSQTYRCPSGFSCWVRFAGERGNKTREVFLRRAYQLAWKGHVLDLWDLTGNQ